MIITLDFKFKILSFENIIVEQIKNRIATVSSNVCGLRKAKKPRTKPVITKRNKLNWGLKELNDFRHRVKNKKIRDIENVSVYPAKISTKSRGLSQSCMKYFLDK
jgi:hypothetical protein